MPSDRPKWEYQVTSYRDTQNISSDGTAQQMQDRLNKCGDDGWELVGVYQSNDPLFIFKRIKD